MDRHRKPQLSFRNGTLANPSKARRNLSAIRRSVSQFMPPLTLSEAVENLVRVNSWPSKPPRILADRINRKNAKDAKKRLRGRAEINSRGSLYLAFEVVAWGAFQGSEVWRSAFRLHGPGAG